MSYSYAKLLSRESRQKVFDRYHHHSMLLGVRETLSKIGGSPALPMKCSFTTRRRYEKLKEKRSLQKQITLMWESSICATTLFKALWCHNMYRARWCSRTCSPKQSMQPRRSSWYHFFTSCKRSVRHRQGVVLRIGMSATEQSWCAARHTRLSWCRLLSVYA